MLKMLRCPTTHFVKSCVIHRFPSQICRRSFSALSFSLDSTNDETASSTSIDLMRRTHALESQYLSPLNLKVIGPLERKGGVDDRLTSLPFVFLLGNHSSGKSTFINHVLKRKVQDTGVAPTDDGFTVIAPGDKDLDQDGPALIGDPDLGFAGLRGFGPSLIQKTQLKVRSKVDIQNFMLIDSPGMIDSPANSVAGQSSSSSSHQDRGYDFPQVTRWFAERADVILLFFDPDKPGTTGETLSILTQSLVGLDHKLHIVLNKVDQFEKLHDFARAYGSLCWNLSKVIPLKDLPRIYTMYIPESQRLSSSSSSPVYSSSAQELQKEADKSIIKAALVELDSIKDEVVKEVFRAPERRVDNLITRLYDASRLLQMHASILEDVRAHFRREWWIKTGVVSVTLTVGTACTVSSVFAAAPISLQLLTAATTLASASGAQFFRYRSLAKLENQLTSESELTGFFKRKYSRHEDDAFVQALWKRVLPQLQHTMHTIGMYHLPKVTSKDLSGIEHVLNHDIPELRRIASPAEKSVAHQVANLFRSPSS